MPCIDDAEMFVGKIVCVILQTRLGNKICIGAAFVCRGLRKVLVSYLSYL